MYLQSEPIRGAGRGTPERVLAIVRMREPARLDAVAAYLREIYRLGAAAGLNADIAAAQAIHETDWFRSRWWAERLNPAGIGITGDPAQNASSRRFMTGEEAARAHLVHLWLYAAGERLPPSLAPHRALDPRWDAAVSAGYAGRCPTLDSLAGTWAADSAYADKIVDFLHRLFPVAVGPDPRGEGLLRFDAELVPMPPFSERLAVNKRDGVGMNRLGPRTLRGIVFHRAQSNGQRFDDAVGWLLRPDVRGLTDFFVNNHSGAMVRINRITGTRTDMAGWAQGPFRPRVASPDGVAFVERYSA
ncbi:MAG: glucosaminidase domain-containing protein [Chloroflexia bacterium]|nr:glucosaminidase domain-containing protein [Chloroflexia bacterium]